MKQTIFVIEDDPGIGELITLLLTEQGYEVRLFTTINSFNRKIGGLLPALLLLDIMLPDGNGLDVCQLWKEDPAKQHVPILMMSAYEENRLDKRAGKADGFISKPFDIKVLLEEVQRRTA